MPLKGKQVPLRVAEIPTLLEVQVPCAGFHLLLLLLRKGCDEIPINRRADSHFSELVKGLVRMSAA